VVCGCVCVGVCVSASACVVDGGIECSCAERETSAPERAGWGGAREAGDDGEGDSLHLFQAPLGLVSF
jgi:hypothetical protein